MKVFLVTLAAFFFVVTLFFGLSALPIYPNSKLESINVYIISMLLSAIASVICMVGVTILYQLEEVFTKMTPAPSDSKSTAAGSSPFEGHAPAWVNSYETGAEIPAYLRKESTERNHSSGAYPYEGYTPSWVAPDEAGEEVPANLRTPSKKDLKPPKKKKKSKK